MNDVKPIINITPLIDVLLVLLIIFMIISPMRPNKFETQIPSEPEKGDVTENADTLIVKINSDTSLELNGATKMGSVADPVHLQKRLSEVFSDRYDNRLLNKNLSLRDKVQKTVFVKAPRSLPYGNVVKVIDAIKTAGANPISLQIDDIE